MTPAINALPGLRIIPESPRYKIRNNQEKWFSSILIA